MKKRIHKYKSGFKLLSERQCSHCSCTFGVCCICRKKMKNKCEHDFKQHWWLIFPDGKTCRKCGYHDSQMSEDGAGVF